MKIMMIKKYHNVQQTVLTWDALLISLMFFWTIPKYAPPLAQMNSGYPGKCVSFSAIWYFLTNLHKNVFIRQLKNQTETVHGSL